MSFLNEPLSLIAIQAKRSIGDITLSVVVSEDTNDTLTITKQPVQQGASITDHAYKEPTTLSMKAYLQDNFVTSLSDIYKKLLKLQSDREPFTVITPKRIYTNMLFAALGQTTDKTTENCLSISASFQEVIIVKISTTQIPRSRQKNPGATAKTEPAGKKSALKVLFGGG